MKYKALKILYATILIVSCSSLSNAGNLYGTENNYGNGNNQTTSGTEYQYESNTGTRYKYDLNKPGDRLKYGVDPALK
jgi:hypothetical protein